MLAAATGARKATAMPVWLSVVGDAWRSDGGRRLWTLLDGSVHDGQADQLTHGRACTVGILGGDGVVHAPVIGNRVALERLDALLELGERVDGRGHSIGQRDDERIGGGEQQRGVELFVREAAFLD